MICYFRETNINFEHRGESTWYLRKFPDHAATIFYQCFSTILNSRCTYLGGEENVAGRQTRSPAVAGLRVCRVTKRLNVYLFFLRWTAHDHPDNYADDNDARDDNQDNWQDIRGFYGCGSCRHGCILSHRYSRCGAFNNGFRGKNRLNSATRSGAFSLTVTSRIFSQTIDVSPLHCNGLSGLSDSRHLPCRADDWG